MNRFYRALLVVLAFEMGAMLLYLPWSVYWEQNFFLSHYPSLMRIVLHPSFRGAVSGVGVLDIFLAIGWIGSRPGPDRVPPQSHRSPAASLLRDRPAQPFRIRTSAGTRDSVVEGRGRRSFRRRLDSDSGERSFRKSLRLAYARGFASGRETPGEQRSPRAHSRERPAGRRSFGTRRRRPSRRE